MGVEMAARAKKTPPKGTHPQKGTHPRKYENARERDQMPTQPMIAEMRAPRTVTMRAAQNQEKQRKAKRSKKRSRDCDGCRRMRWQPGPDPRHTRQSITERRQDLRLRGGAGSGQVAIRGQPTRAKRTGTRIMSIPSGKWEKQQDDSRRQDPAKRCGTVSPCGLAKAVMAPWTSHHLVMMVKKW